MASAHDKWGALGVHNPINLIARFKSENPNKVAVYIEKSVNDGSRFQMGKAHGYQVVGFKFKTDPTGPWINNGHKTFFTHFYGNWGTAFSSAQAWAKEKFAYEEDFVAIVGFGSARFPKPVADWAKQYLKDSNR